MDLYRKIKRKARSTRDRDVRIKLELFLLALKLNNVTEACARRGFSRRFYYRWWGRFERSGFSLASLQERKRTPKRQPGRSSKDVEKRIHWYRRRRYGCRQIQALLARHHGIKLSRTTICHILNGRKKVKRNARARLKLHRKRYELLIPGQRLQLDVEYVPYPVAGARAFTYVIVDECTRWRFARAYFTLDETTTLGFLEEFKKVCPFPVHTIQTDNGFEFTYALNPQISAVREHGMTQWCKAHGIRHRLIPPGVKELNGKVERSHRIDAQYFYWRAPSHDLAKFNRALTFWIGYYNHHRLHGGLSYITPMEKLAERRKTLKSEGVPQEWREFKLKFLESRSKGYPETNQDRQIQALEHELQTLLKKVA
jgi:transposase